MEEWSRDNLSKRKYLFNALILYCAVHKFSDNSLIFFTTYSYRNILIYFAQLYRKKEYNFLQDFYLIRIYNSLQLHDFVDHDLC